MDSIEILRNCMTNVGNRTGLYSHQNLDIRLSGSAKGYKAYIGYLVKTNPDKAFKTIKEAIFAAIDNYIKRTMEEIEDLKEHLGELFKHLSDKTNTPDQFNYIVDDIKEAETYIEYHEEDIANLNDAKVLIENN